MGKYARIAKRETWCIDPVWLVDNLGNDFEMVAKSARLPKVDGQVAILPLYGMITQRGSIWQDMFGGTSTQAFGAAYTRAVNDDRIKAIVFDVDSPGGTISGVEELSEIIAKGTNIKLTVAVANSLMASAAYWISSQVGKGKLYAAPGSEVGSVGVFRMHEDVSEAMAKNGVKVEFLAVPEYKTEGNPFEPLTDDAREWNMGQVQATYDRFVQAVSRGRETNRKAVMETYGRGRSLHALQAADAGMVDGIETLTSVLAKLGIGTGKAQLSACADTELELCEAWTFGMPSEMRITSPEDRKRRLRLFELT